MDSVVHFEVPADDLDRAKRFYTDVFGWQIMDIPEVNYTGVITTGVDPTTQMPTQPGAINGGMYKRERPDEPATWVVDVASVDETLKKIEQAGGTVVDAKSEVPNMGYYARFRDTEGNLVGVWETTPQQSAQ